MRVDGNDYAVHPSVVGRRVDVVADLNTVTVTCAGAMVARHERCWARHQSITDPAHAAAARVLRAQHRTAMAVREDDVEQRRLGDYDDAFGLQDSITVVPAGEQVA